MMVKQWKPNKPTLRDISRAMNTRPGTAWTAAEVAEVSGRSLSTCLKALRWMMEKGLVLETTGNAKRNQRFTLATLDQVATPKAKAKKRGGVRGMGSSGPQVLPFRCTGDVGGRICGGILDRGPYPGWSYVCRSCRRGVSGWSWGKENGFA